MFDIWKLVSMWTHKICNHLIEFNIYSVPKIQCLSLHDDDSLSLHWDSGVTTNGQHTYHVPNYTRPLSKKAERKNTVGCGVLCRMYTASGCSPALSRFQRSLEMFQEQSICSSAATFIIYLRVVLLTFLCFSKDKVTFSAHLDVATDCFWPYLNIAVVTNLCFILFLFFLVMSAGQLNATLKHFI